MKKIMILAISLALMLCLVPGPVFASGNLIDDWLGKLQGIASDPGSGYSEEAPKETGAYSAKQLYEMTAPKVVEITTYDVSGNPFARGSGFFIDDQGTVVTNYHVIEDSCSAEVQTATGEISEVKMVLGYDKEIDLAILNTGIKGNPFLHMPAHPVSTGDTIYTLGSALGLTGTFSDGLVATASRVIDGVDYIQITAPISHGNSGGPLINIYGEVIGINTMGMDDGQNVNFSVNINELAKLDITRPVTMEDLYYQNGGSDTPQTSIATDDSEVSEWLANTDHTEIESNDSFGWADTLRNEYTMSGSVEGTEDFDYFSIYVIDKTTVDILLATYYEEDAEYLIAGLVDAEGNILEYAQPEEYEDTTYLSLQTDIETPGTYYVVVCVPDEYPYEEPAYYKLNAVW